MNNLIRCTVASLGLLTLLGDAPLATADDSSLDKRLSNTRGVVISPGTPPGSDASQNVLDEQGRPLREDAPQSATMPSPNSGTQSPQDRARENAFQGDNQPWLDQSPQGEVLAPGGQR